ncbi:MAG: DUF2079 domain-containing protein [Planctomycetales bacterium]|nr:DUF2079 domain-containing protein [Planctomycetales bacterium]
MSTIHKSRSGLVSCGLFLLGSLLLSGMIFTVMSDANLSLVFWPNDIHEFFISCFGGNTTKSVSGVSQTNLPAASVFLRVAGALLGITILSHWVASSKRQTTAAQVEAKSKVSFRSLSFSSRTAAIARPGVFAGVWLAVWFAAPLVSRISFTAFVATTTPYALTLILASILNEWLSQISDTSAINPESATAGFVRVELAVVIIAVFVWEAMSFWMNERLYAGLLVPHGDSAMYEEHLWNVWHGKGFRSYLDQGLFLGEHIQVIHLLLLPLHILFPSYLTMEACASFSLAICAIPVFSIARRHSGSSRAAMWLALGWLLFFPMHYLDIAIDLKTLRPSCYGMPFLFWGIDFAEQRKLWRSSLFFLIALSTQEDFALVVGSIGLVLFLCQRQTASKTSSDTTDSSARRLLTPYSKWSLGVLLFSVFYVLLAVLVIIPGFRDGAHVHYSRYFGELGSSPGDLVRTALRDPGKVMGVFFSFRTLTYLVMLTIPLGALTWRRPVYLLAGVPTFVMLSLIQLGNDSGSAGGSSSVDMAAQIPPIPYHHFHAPLLPVLLWAAAAGLSQNQRSVRWARFAFLCALLTAVTGSMMPMGANFWSGESSYGWKNLYVPGPRAAEFQKVIEKIPVTARVASTDYAHTRFTHFERSYDYSGYLRAVNNYQSGVPADTDYIVLDTSHPYSEVRSLADVRELRVEPEKWEVLPDETGGLFIILKRKH